MWSNNIIPHFYLILPPNLHKHHIIRHHLIRIIIVLNILHNILELSNPICNLPNILLYFIHPIIQFFLFCLGILGASIKLISWKSNRNSIEDNLIEKLYPFIYCDRFGKHFGIDLRFCSFQEFSIDIILKSMEFVPQSEKETSDEIALDIIRCMISLGKVDERTWEDPQKEGKNLVNR